MNVSPNVNRERIEEADIKLQSQLNKCLNEKRRRQCEIGYLDELAGLLSANAPDMCSLSIKPDKCAILQETVNQIKRIKLEENTSNDLQQSVVSSSRPNILANDILGPLLLEAIDGFLFVVNTDGKIEFVSENVKTFLKYSQENLVDNCIYSYLHHGDHTRFGSILLPMSIGNGFGWNSDSNCLPSKSKFNCRFMIKSSEEQGEKMEDPLYENLQVAAVLVPHAPRENNENAELDSEVHQNHLVCVARRIPENEKNSSSIVEQFTTRMDMSGKILTIDTSGVSSTYSQHLKEFVGHIIQELCHPNDFQKLNQHLKETLQIGSNTSGVYRLRVAPDSYIHVRTKSKRFNFNLMANEQEIIVATHSIIRDNEHMLDSNIAVSQRSNPSPASGNVTPALSNTMNGNTYSFPSLSPHEFSLNDIGLDMFPSSNWDLGANDGPEVVVEVSSIPSTTLCGAAASTPVSTNSIGSAGVPRTPSAPGSAFSPELLSNRGSPPSQSPAAQLSSNNSPAPGRGTPFTNSFAFSPIQAQQSRSRTTSPAPLVHAKRETLSGGELSSLSPVTGLLADGQDSSANVKLRNLLTHGLGSELDSSHSKNSIGEKMEIEATNGERLSFGLHSNSENCLPSSQDNILRDLLNQDDDELNDGEVKTLQRDSHHNNMSLESCSSDMVQKKPANAMLRKLLNNEEEDNFRRDQEPLIQQLLKTEGKAAMELNMVSQRKSLDVSFQSPSMDSVPPMMKRKSPSTMCEEPLAKRQTMQNSPHAHLAGANPMLASMLAQTPRTAPTVPTSVANAIVSQLPQERLPKNLEKKLVHTPYTGTTTAPSNSQYSYTHVQGPTRSLHTTSLQQEVVTADSRGHVTLAPQNNIRSSYPQAQFLSKVMSGMENNQQITGMQHTGNGPQFGVHQQQQQQQHNMQQNSNQMFADISGDPNMNHNMMQTSDPLLSEILDQVWSMEQDMNMETTMTDDLALYKLLEDIPDPAPVPSPKLPTVHDVNEKMAINAIQRQLMSFEVTSAPNAARNNNNSQHFHQNPNLMNAAQNQLAQNSFTSQVNHYPGAPPAYTVSSVQRTRAPPMATMQASAIPSNPHQMVQIGNQRQVLTQYNLTSLNDVPPQMRRNLMERRQKLFLQRETQRRLMLQKQQQMVANRQHMQADNIQISGSNQFSENISDLMNNTVAPNVSLQRATSMPESQLSPRYAALSQMANSNAPPQSPQLSPGQRQQPFSPMSQQGYQNNYQQSRLSPHMSPQPTPNQSWAQRATQANLQQQNPMLNAQLSQGSFANQGQSRFPNQPQQQRQMVVRSLPSPGSRNSPYSNQPDSPFHPPSPGAAMFQQQPPSLPPQTSQPQQRLQRAVSIPNRVNSPRSLQAGYGANDPLLSPQPSPVSNYNPSIPASSTANYNQDVYGYDQQVYPSSNMDRNRNTGGNINSEYVRQELRAMVGARTQHQQQHQGHPQQMMQQMQQSSGAHNSNQLLSQTDFDVLGFSLDLPSDAQSSSAGLFSQSLLSVGGASDNLPPTNSPRFQAEEVRPVEPKKSLLQQLLSEPS